MGEARMPKLASLTSRTHELLTAQRSKLTLENSAANLTITRTAFQID